MNIPEDELDSLMTSVECQMLGVRVPAGWNPDVYDTYRDEIHDRGEELLRERYKSAERHCSDLAHMNRQLSRELRGTRRVLNCICVVCALLLGLCGGMLWRMF